jgi:putative long chain acyl-CoA synthase
MASSFNPPTFWEEARRYGVTVASYTWTMLNELTKAPPQPGERHHSVRLFIGSGMPRGLWRRVQERFKPARVLEFYASTEAGAILVNLSGAKPGSMGRPLPGSAEVRIAAYDVDQNRLVLGEDGFAIECGADEVGLLLARVSKSENTTMTPLRGVFSREDAWLATGDLFRRDKDGDFWRVDGLSDVIRTEAGPVFTVPIRDALTDLPAVDLAVAYGVLPGSGEHQIAVAAVTLRPDHELDADDLTHALASLPVQERPTIVQVVDEIPVTTWYRPLTGPLRAAGVPEPGPDVQAWSLQESGAYEPLTHADTARLSGQAA